MIVCANCLVRVKTVILSLFLPEMKKDLFHFSPVCTVVVLYDTEVFVVNNCFNVLAILSIISSSFHYRCTTSSPFNGDVLLCHKVY